MVVELVAPHNSKFVEVVVAACVQTAEVLPAFAAEHAFVVAAHIDQRTRRSSVFYLFVVAVPAAAFCFSMTLAVHVASDRRGGRR